MRRRVSVTPVAVLWLGAAWDVDAYASAPAPAAERIETDPPRYPFATHAPSPTGGHRRPWGIDAVKACTSMSDCCSGVCQSKNGEKVEQVIAPHGAWTWRVGSDRFGIWAAHS